MTECKEDWQWAKNQWPIADEQRKSKAKWQWTKKQWWWSKYNDKEWSTMAKQLQAKKRWHWPKNNDKMQRNNDNKQRQQHIDWQVNNLKLLPWDKSNLFLFEEVKMAMTARERRQWETDQIVIQVVGECNWSLQVITRMIFHPKRISYHNRSKYHKCGE